MSQISGQLSIFDWASQNMVSAPPELLFPGQDLYLVNKGEISLWHFPAEEKSRLITRPLYGNYVLVGGCSAVGESKQVTKRFYDLTNEKGYHAHIANEDFGSTAFMDYEKAKKAADSFLRTHDVILGSDLRPIETAAYRYIRSIDGRALVSHYSVLDNGMAYLKGFMTYAHMEPDSKKLRKAFHKQLESDASSIEQIDFVPEFLNMYRCTKESNWTYAEAAYSMALG